MSVNKNNIYQWNVNENVFGFNSKYFKENTNM